MGIRNAFGLLNVQEDADRYFDRISKQELQDEVRYLGGELDNIREDMLKISDAFDNVGWSPLSEAESSEMKLETVKKVATIARAMYALNPFIKRGVNARISYIWGKGVTFDGVESIENVIDDNHDKLYSAQAYEELERVLATAGNDFTALPIYKERDLAFRITLEDIQGVITNPRDREDIWYYKRQYIVTQTNPETGILSSKTETKYYASAVYYEKLLKEGKNLPRRWGKIGVEQNFVILHTTVNKQIGWRWGLPDVMAVIFWAKAYKEYLEDNAMLVKAYSRLAWQVKASSSQGGTQAGTQVMRPPTRDPMTGELRDIGGTAITGASNELAPLPATGSSVDFDKGSALASAIASGLEVSKVVITSDPGSGNRATAETLDLPTLKAMESRQSLHQERFLKIFRFWGAKVRAGSTPTVQSVDAQESARGKGSDIAIVTWPQIETDATKDRVASIGVATELGLLYPEEGRKEIIDVLGIAPMKPWDELPTPEDYPFKVYEQKNAQLALDQKQQSVIPSQGNSGGTSAKGGALATNNQSRDSRADNQNNS